MTPAAVQTAAGVDELDARAIAGLMMANMAPGDTWPAAGAPPARRRRSFASRC